MKEEGKGNNFPLNLFHLHQEQGGTQRTLVDAAGQLLYAWDAEDRETEIVYDALRRPLKKITDTKELEVYVYGEGLINAKAKNLRGQLYQHYDGSGLQQINIYDFKGNALATQQQLLEDATISDVDWSFNPVLSAEIFTSAITYDALNRPITQTDHGGNVQAFTYDKGGVLKKVKLNTDEYVNDIHYDAQGQRKAIWYGNGTKTSYSYDAFTFRLRRFLTVNLNNNEILQDLNYWYDPVGNITEIQDAAQQTLFFNNSVVNPTQKFVYDAIYRLSEAKGRELIGTNFGSEDNWNDAAWQTSHKGDGSAVQNYTQKYSYDEVGNILELQHIAGSGSYTRTYEINTNSNGLLSTEVGSNTYAYSHDERGNMTKMPHLDSMAWNTQNELKSILKGNEPTYYQYSGGERVRKFTDKGIIKEERIYLGSYEIYRKYVNNVLDIERTTVHVSDDTGRIAMLEARTVGTDPSLPFLQRYIYSNHLQSASLELDEDGAIISYEEYHPYGTTSYQANNTNINSLAKRYRYTGKERDEESGLYYHGARYYIPWLARWTAVDPLESKYAGMSPYNYGFNNPVVFNDPSGNSPDLPETSKSEYGEKQVYIHKGSYVDDGFGGVTRDKKKVTPSGIAVSKGMSELDLYRFAIDRVLNPGERTIKNDRYLDERYFAIEDKVKGFINLRLLIGSMPDTKEYRKQTAEFKEKILLSILSNDKDAQGNLAQIKRSISFGGRHNFAYEGGKLLAMGLATGIAKATAREMAGNLFSNILKEETTSQTNRYVKLLTEFGEYDATKILYRGISGSEKAGAQIFFTDNSAAAATYVKNGGQIVETRVSQFGLKKLELDGKLEVLQDLHKGVRHTSYKFQGAELREALMRITNPSKK